MKTWSQQIKDAWQIKKQKKWDKLYFAIDLHDTIITGTYNKNNNGAVIYPYAKETLDYLYHHDVYQTILWTSSHDTSINEVIKRFDLKFNYFNHNPECPSNDLCNFDKKMYFNFLLDDKAGFEPQDWIEIYETIEKLDYDNVIPVQFNTK